MPEPIVPRSGLELLVGAATPTSDGVVIRLCSGRAVASVIARRDCSDALAARVREMFGLDLPPTPRRVVAGGFAFAWAGPGQWLAMADGAEAGSWMARLRALSDLAAVSRQGDGRTILAVAGRDARATLAKLIPIDLHPRAFAPHDTALTLAGHIPVQLWQVDATPSYELAVFRSYAVALWRSLTDATGEFVATAGA